MFQYHAETCRNDLNTGTEHFKCFDMWVKIHNFYHTNPCCMFVFLSRRGNTSTSVTSDLSTRSSASLYEEQFEDYGAGEEPDYTPSSPSAEDESRTHIYSDLGSSVPSRWERETHFYVDYGFESVLAREVAGPTR